MREKMNFNNDWKVISDDKFTGNFMTFFESLSEKNELNQNLMDVDLPHSNCEQPLNSSGGRNKQNVLWYFNTLPDFSDDYEKIIIEFEGVMMESIFYINGKPAFEHNCGYTPAVFDIKPFLQSSDNTIAIRVSNLDNNLIPPGKPQRDLDYNYDGGIYRNVTITTLRNIHFSHPLLANKIAGGGIYCSTLNASENSACLQIKSNINCFKPESIEYFITHTLINNEGIIIAQDSKEVSFSSVSNIDTITLLDIDQPLLWSPSNPYLYTLLSEIKSHDNTVLDSVLTPIGIRELNITYQSGFSINGKHMKVNGGNYHQSFGQLGNAVPENLLRRDARKLKRAGFDHIRTHYPPAEAFIDECDKIGLMLTISNPGWQYFEQGEFETTSYKNMRTILRWLRNHPSIIIWEANLNESNMTDSFMKKMQDLVHEELPIGDIYTGSHSEYSDILYTNIDPDMIFGDLDTIQNASLKPTWVREYGDNPDNWSDQNTVWRTKRKWGEHLMLRQVNRLISTKYNWMTSYTDMYNSQLVAGFGLWPAIEYNRGYHMNPCYGGVMDLQRLPKYSYYFMQSQRDMSQPTCGMTFAPMLFIANSGTEYAPDDITIYTNCDYAKLYYNGEYITTEYPQDIPIKHPPIIFDGSFRVARDRSSIVVEGFIDNDLVITKEVKGHGVAKKLRITIDDEEVNFTTRSNDIVVLHVEALDDQDNRVIYGCDEFPIKVKSNPGGKIIGDCIKNLELGITSFLLRGNNNEIDINIEAMLAIEQPYNEIQVSSTSISIPKIKESDNE